MRIRSLIALSLLTPVLATLAPASLASPVGVDGTIGAEWSGPGVILTHVPYDAGAPSGNFGSPTPGTNNVAYDVYLRSDASYLYVALQSIGDTGGQNFANLYFNTNLSGGSDWGIEATNTRAFVPGVAGYYDLTGFMDYATSAGGNVNYVIELAIAWSYLSSDPQNIIPDDTNVSNGVQLRTSQSFGYTATGGDLAGGTRFGTVAQPTGGVPEPATLALLGLGLLGASAARRRQRA